jgi:hypothetical protein
LGIGLDSNTKDLNASQVGNQTIVFHSNPAPKFLLKRSLVKKIKIIKHLWEIIAHLNAGILQRNMVI